MIDELNKRFEPILAEFLASPSIKRIVDGELTVAEYREMMRQTFHYTRENPQMQALATVYFRGRHRDMVAPFYKHAAEEIGHEYLALNDFVTLGGDPTNVPYENPLPATSGLIAYGFHHIYNLSHLGHLGYIYFLERLPVVSGPILMDQLKGSSIPENAMTFLRDHAEIDIEHTALMDKYFPVLVSDERDMDCIEYAMKTTAYLFNEMLAQCIEAAANPIDVGWNWEELNADRLTPPLKKAETKTAVA
ncbi:MAG: iron-containing redox enzyme family protein [Pseudomonadota bacterium]